MSSPSAVSSSSSRPRRNRTANQLSRRSDFGNKGPVVARLSIDHAVRGETGILEGNLGGLIDRSVAGEFFPFFIPSSSYTDEI